MPAETYADMTEEDIERMAAFWKEYLIAEHSFVKRLARELDMTYAQVLGLMHLRTLEAIASSSHLTGQIARMFVQPPMPAPSIVEPSAAEMSALVP